MTKCLDLDLFIVYRKKVMNKNIWVYFPATCEEFDSLQERQFQRIQVHLVKLEKKCTVRDVMVYSAAASL